MKTRKIYETPRCDTYRLRLGMGELCGGNMGIFSSYTDFQGAKKSQFVYDDEAEENPEYEL